MDAYLIKDFCKLLASQGVSEYRIKTAIESFAIDETKTPEDRDEFIRIASSGMTLEQGVFELMKESK